MAGCEGALLAANTRRVETKTMTGIGVKKNSPVVKLLPECDDWIR
jgi:hypothetical protein